MNRRHRSLRMIFCAAVVLAVTAVARAGDEVEIQAALDARRTYQLEPGRTYLLDAPLQLRAGMTLAGTGFSTVLEYQGEGDTALYFGEADPDKAIYATYVRDLAIRGGGVRVQRSGQHCLMESVWVIEAPAAAFHIEGPGDRFLMRDCIAWNSGEGFVIVTDLVNNGLILDHCNAQGNFGYGLRCETVGSPHAYLPDLMVRDFTCQGNQRDKLDDAEILLRGNILDARFEHLYIEAVSARVGIRCEGVDFPAERARRAPRNLCVESGSRIEGKTAITSVEILSGEGVVVRDSKLRHPIRRSYGLPEVKQEGPYKVESLFITKDDDMGPPKPVTGTLPAAAASLR